MLGYHDLALARLDREVRLRSIIQPACLPTDEDIPPPHTKATVAGWGTTREGKASPVLQKVRVPLMDPSKCEKLVKRYRLLKALYPRGVTGRILCAGAEEKDSCKGDSGGPLMIRRAHDSCQYEVLGIVSAGLGCGLPDIPGFYTEIPAYLDWIEGIVWERDP
ncbi:unnamed protein product [Darwinula stevensoni]|uniref:Peptidase S1 domain-containing protein n=1 Tax=Darwinula stevensoni TaxID=69355 RepID=A0A7R8XCR3_9CRUS|nr:unnamed protein product [Darwinula stevensoni]CAG0887971.1 unnamed protein product [Darwinula stevensoni]